MRMQGSPHTTHTGSFPKHLLKPKHMDVGPDVILREQRALTPSAAWLTSPPERPVTCRSPPPPGTGSTGCARGALRSGRACPPRGSAW